MNTYNTKQLIIVRKDLNMPAGKLASQVAHASVNALLSQNKPTDPSTPRQTINTPAAIEWLNGDHAKVVLQTQNEDTLQACYDLAKSLGFPVSKIIDNGTTIFNNVETFTCIAIGPEYTEKLNSAFSHLKLYKD